MNTNPLNILLIAEEGAGIEALRIVQQSGHALVAALTSNAAQAQTGVAAVCRRQGLPCWESRRVRHAELADVIRAAAVDLILNIHSLHVIHPRVLAAPRIGAFNLHPGPLPRYAGLNAPNWAIFHGEVQHAVTLHWMEAGIDTGAIAYQQWMDIHEDETGLTLSLRCAEQGMHLIRQLLRDAPGGDIPHTPQALHDRQYYGRAVPHGGLLDWAWPARQVVDFVRACQYAPLVSPWGTPVATLAGTSVKVHEAKRTDLGCAARSGVMRVQNDALEVAAADEWVRVDLLEVDGVCLDGLDFVLQYAPGTPGFTFC